MTLNDTPPTPVKLKKAARREKIKELIPEDLTYQEMADRLGVSLSTINRDMSAWQQSGGMEEWLRREFFRLHRHVKGMEGKEPLAYTTVANLLGKTLTQKVEQKTEGKQTVVVKLWRPEPDGDHDKAPPS